MTREHALNLQIGDAVKDMKNPGYEQGTIWVVHGEWKGGFPIMVRSGRTLRMINEWNLGRYEALRPRYTEKQAA